MRTKLRNIRSTAVRLLTLAAIPSMALVGISVLDFQTQFLAIVCGGGLVAVWATTN